METIKEFCIMIPPLSQQQQFAAIVQRFNRVYKQQREALRQAEHLFQTLLHKAFQGELSLDESKMALADVETDDQQTSGVADVVKPVDRDAYQLALPLE
jgi:hypothetical protein